MQTKTGRRPRGHFNYMHEFTLAQELRNARLNKRDTEMVAAFLSRVFRRRTVNFDVDNFMSMCLGLTEGKNAANVYDSFITGCLCEDGKRCNIRITEVPESSED